MAQEITRAKDYVDRNLPDLRQDVRRRQIQPEDLRVFLRRTSQLVLANLADGDDTARQAAVRALRLYGEYEAFLGAGDAGSPVVLDGTLDQSVAVLREPDLFGRLCQANQQRRGNTADWFSAVYKTMRNDDGSRTDDAGELVDCAYQRFTAQLNNGLSPILRQQRGMTPVLAATLSTPIGKSLGREAIRAEAQRRTRETISLLRDTYRPTLVVGTGPAGQAFCNNLLELNPEDAGSFFMVDEGVIPGGQFYRSDRRAHGLNNQTRPTTDRDPIPGTGTDLTSLGPGIIEAADLSGDAYVGNDVIGLATAVRSLSVTQLMMMGVRVVAVRPNESALDGRYAVQLAVQDTGETFDVFVDNVVFTSGIGADGNSFDEFYRDDVQQVIAEEREKFRRTGAADYLPFGDLMEVVGSRRQFPRELFGAKKDKNVVVIGPQDSFRVTALGLLGYGEFDPGQSVANLDWVPDITVIGEKPLTDDEVEELFGEQAIPGQFNRAQIRERGVTREVLCKRLRARYLALVGEYPRFNDERFSRLQPRTGSRSKAMQRLPNGNLRFLYTDENGEEQVIDNALIIDCGGKVDLVDETLESLVEPETVTGRSIPQSFIDATLDIPGSVLFTSDSSRSRNDGKDVRSVRVQRVLRPANESGSTALVRVVVTHMDGTQKPGLVENTFGTDGCVMRFGDREFILRPASVSRVDAARTPARVPQNDSSDPRSQSSQTPYGEALLGQSIYFYGAADRQGVDEIEARDFGGAFRIGENTKSLFRQMARVGRGARALAARRQSQIEQGQTEAFEPVMEFPGRPAQTIATGARGMMAARVSAERARGTQLLPGEALLMLKQMLGLELRDLRFSGRQLDITVSRVDGTNTLQYTSPSPVDRDAAQALADALARWAGNAAVQAALLQLTHKGKEVSIRLPVAPTGGQDKTLDYPNARITTRRPEAPEEPPTIDSIIARTREAVAGVLPRDVI